jgi:hypothetical protein
MLNMDEKYDRQLGNGKEHRVEVSTKELDTAATLIAGSIGTLDPREADRIR